MRFVELLRAGTGYGIEMGKRCFVIGDPGSFVRMPRAAECGFPQASRLRCRVYSFVVFSHKAHREHKEGVLKFTKISALSELRDLCG